MQETQNGAAAATWHVLSVEDILATLKSDAGRGLSRKDVQRLLQEFGPNELQEQEGRGAGKILWEQLTETMVLILVAAAIISGLLGKWLEASAILAIVILFVALGFIQEYRAEKAMAALKRMAVPRVRARREGTVQDIPAGDLVPGDIVLLEAGNILPADLRIIEAVNLRVQESSLTGESEAVEKMVKPLKDKEVPLGDRRNMGYMGTTVTYGRGSGVVVATGMKTELGNIAGLLQTSREEMTPLQQRLDRVGKMLALVGVICAVIVALLGVLYGQSLVEAFLTAVSVAVAVVPEGLPAVVTITLALGARRMLARHALIRKLPAVETLGSVTTICSDKTGTLTENRMTVTALSTLEGEISLESDSIPNFSDASAATSGGGLELLLAGGALCNDAELAEQDAEGFHSTGDPTEGALVVAGAAFGLLKQDLEKNLPRIGELPFDSERKRMTTVHGISGVDNSPLRKVIGVAAPHASAVLFTKGAVDGLLEISAEVWANGKREPMSAAYRQQIEAANSALAQNGMRVLGVAYKPLEGEWGERNEAAEETVEFDVTLERDLIFVGIFGILDPPRPEVKDAVAVCKQAGIRPVMITGDHPLTALHIARELGIASTGDRAVTGLELDTMADDALDALVEEVPVYARVSPEHKLRIVRALRRRGHVTAMTGDGVNDAPALKEADIGVAMGITGTDVSKEAARMVLQDDNFSTIVAAVEEGRVIYDNLRKFIKFSIGGNIGKIVVMLCGVLVGMASPLLPLQLLWLNLLTDGLLGVGLGVEKAERNIMSRKPVPPGSSIFSDNLGRQIIGVGLFIGIISLGAGAYYFNTSHEHWQTVMFTTLAFSQVWQALGTRSGGDSLFRIGFFSNIPLLILIGIVTATQIAAIYLPVLQTFLKTEPLTWNELVVCVALSSLVLAYTEVEKLIFNRKKT